MKRDKRGFTLAELLVVVAIIAVLVAIAIPIFTNQLEKSREATDAANIRSQYAQVMTDAITEGGDVNGKNVYGAINLNQKKENWQDTTTGTNLHGLFQEVDGHPVPNGTAWVEYKASESKVILHYEGEGSSNGDSSFGGNTGGNGGSSGGTSGSNVSASDLINNATVIPSDDYSYQLKIGNIYKIGDKYYVALNSQNYAKPSDAGYLYAELRTDEKIRTKDDLVPENENSTEKKIFKDLKGGSLYKDDEGNVYIYKYDYQGSINTPPTSSSENVQWVRINISEQS